MKKIYLSEIDSTNLYAKLNLSDLSDKTVIQAGIQTAGRGRLNRAWVNLGKGNLFLSIVLKPSVIFCETYSNLTQYLSVVLCEVLKEYGVTPQIKWPNDVLINGEKIAGILCESIVQGSTLKGIILGIGVNLNADKNDLSLVCDKKITALNLETGCYIDCNNFSEKLINTFFKSYEEFLKKGFMYIKKDYINNLLYVNSEIEIVRLNDKVKGSFKSINDNGELELLCGDRTIVINYGDII